MIFNRKEKLRLRIFKSLFLLFLLVPLKGQVDYSSQIQPIFNLACTQCHGNAAGLNLSSYENIMLGSNNGDMVVPYDHVQSELWQRVNSGQMPPGNNDLSDTQVDLIAQWIDEGALPEASTSSLAGDLNEDGILNVLDVILMVNLALDEGYEDIADMNEDGIINILDIVILLNTILN